MHSYLENSVPSSGRPMEIELIRSIVNGTATEKQKSDFRSAPAVAPPESDAFIANTAARWLQIHPAVVNAKRLFGDFWYEGELCILFADTNTGKSILAVQIADSLSKGACVPGFENETAAGPVLYFDFELDAAQFARRYRDPAGNAYRFHQNLYRVVPHPEAPGLHKFNSYADYIGNAIENLLLQTGARTVIIDNLSCLQPGTEATATAISLMRSLQDIKNRYRLSILALAHTPKRNPTRPLTRNDLQGSKMLINFADSAFAMGESHTRPGTRYLKQVKQRSGAETYGPGNVCLCRIVQPGNFLQMEFTGAAAEADHLLHYTEKQRRDLEQRIQQLHTRGNSLRQIVQQTGLSLSTVQRVIRRMKALESGE